MVWVVGRRLQRLLLKARGDVPAGAIWLRCWRPAVKILAGEGRRFSRGGHDPAVQLNRSRT